jgi:broad specificity phosphatase PhoE
MTTIVLVRHGETEWNRVERFRGRVDVPLNLNGQRQAVATAKFIRTLWRPAAVYSSPLTRAVQTALPIAAQSGLSIKTLPDFIDLDYGEWQGHTVEEVKMRWHETYFLWQRAPHTVRIPGGETLEELRERGMTALYKLIQLHKGETIVIVGHQDLNRAILISLLNLGLNHFWSIQQNNCAINRIVSANGDDRVNVISINETAHLVDKVN